MNTLKKIDDVLENVAIGLGRTVRQIKQWWQSIPPVNQWKQQFLLWRQKVYVEELRDNIVVTKRGLAHLQSTHAEQNRELIKMQSKLV